MAGRASSRRRQTQTQRNERLSAAERTTRASARQKPVQVDPEVQAAAADNASGSGRRGAQTQRSPSAVRGGASRAPTTRMKTGKSSSGKSARRSGRRPVDKDKRTKRLVTNSLVGVFALVVVVIFGMMIANSGPSEADIQAMKDLEAVDEQIAIAEAAMDSGDFSSASDALEEAATIVEQDVLTNDGMQLHLLQRSEETAEKVEKMQGDLLVKAWESQVADRAEPLAARLNSLVIEPDLEGLGKETRAFRDSPLPYEAPDHPELEAMATRYAGWFDNLDKKLAEERQRRDDGFQKPDFPQKGDAANEMMERKARRVMPTVTTTVEEFIAKRRWDQAFKSMLSFHEREGGDLPLDPLWKQTVISAETAWAADQPAFQERLAAADTDTAALQRLEVDVGEAIIGYGLEPLRSQAREMLTEVRDQRSEASKN